MDMKIPEGDRDIFAALRFRADADPSVEYKLTGQKHEVVHRAISRGLEDGTVFFTAIVNPYLIGLSRFSVYFSLSSAGRDKRARVRELIRSYEHIAWGAEIGGEFDFALTLTARTPDEARLIIERFNAESGEVFQERVIYTQLRIFIYPLRFLSTRAANDPPLEVGPGGEEVPISFFHCALLKWLGNHGRPVVRDITRTLGVSARDVDEGLAYLRKTRVLACVGLVPNVEKFNLQVFVLLVHTRNANATVREAMRAFCAKNERIDRLIECLGSWDFEVGACVEREEDAASIANQIIIALGQERVSHIKIVPLYQEFGVNWLPSQTLSSREAFSQNKTCLSEIRW